MGFGKNHKINAGGQARHQSKRARTDAGAPVPTPRSPRARRFRRTRPLSCTPSSYRAGASDAATPAVIPAANAMETDAPAQPMQPQPPEVPPPSSPPPPNTPMRMARHARTHTTTTTAPQPRAHAHSTWHTPIAHAHMTHTHTQRTHMTRTHMTHAHAHNYTHAHAHTHAHSPDRLDRCIDPPAACSPS